VGDNSRDYDTLIEAVKDMPLRLKIITNMRLRKNHHCNIETRPWLQPVLLREEYARARFVVVPLHDVPSASGATALLEAMAMGKAVIVSDSRGIRDFVKDGQDAVVVRSGDAGLLRQAILRLDSDAEERKRIGLLARRAVVENFGTAKQAAALAKIYRELLRA
jgi:glycosyltransferase involved in cell wall biosynthesis